MAFQLALGCTSGVHRTCCPCPLPVVVCTKRTGTARIYDYTISGADTAWYVKRCTDSSGVQTDTTVAISPPVNGSITPDANCTYTVYASNACGEPGLFILKFVIYRTHA